MKKKLLVLLVLFILFSTAISASPFNLIVGKDSSTVVSFGGTGPAEFNSNPIDLPDSVYVYSIPLFTQKQYNRCGGYWFAELYNTGLLIEKSENQAFCPNHGCTDTAKFNYVLTDKVQFDTENFRTDTSRGSCTFVVDGEVKYIDGVKIQKEIPFYIDSNEPINIGRLDYSLANSDLVFAADDEATIASDNPQVKVWIGSSISTDDITIDDTTTTDAGNLQKNIWACYDSDSNNECDFIDGRDCIADGGDYYKGVCCGVDIKDSGMVREYNEELIDAYCGRTNSQEWKWAAFDQIGEIQNLDYAPGYDIVSDGSEIFSCDGEQDSFTGINNHEYICHNNNLYECGGQKPFSSLNSFDTGQTSLEITGNSCPIGLQGYWKFEDNTADFLQRAGGSTSGNINYASGILGKAAVFSGSEKITLSNPLIDIDGPGFTAEAWIYPTDVTGKRSIFSKDFAYELNIIDGQLAAAIVTDSNNNFKLFNPASQIDIRPNVWYHVALTFDGEFAKIYLDGSEVRSIKAGTEEKSNIIQKSDLTDPFLFLGDKQAESRPFKGKIDEFAIYSVALTENEIQKHAATPISAYCFDNPYTTLMYCASDGDWAPDLDVKDEISCNLAGFDWTGHSCCSEDDDLEESYNDFAMEMQEIENHIIESSENVNKEENELILDEDGYIILKGPLKFKVVTQALKKTQGNIMEYCNDVSIQIYNLTTEKNAKKITHIKDTQTTDPLGCVYRKKIISPMTMFGIGGCIEKEFISSGSFVDDEQKVINYQGQFYACDLPESSSLWNIKDTKTDNDLIKPKSSCGDVLQDILYDESVNAKHAVCLPDGKWYLTDNPHTTKEKTISWEGTEDTLQKGCCPEEECWNGLKCQKTATYHRIGDSGFVCK